MIPRSMQQRLTALAKQFPVVVLSGPRQSGKTTLIRAMYPDYPYINLERPDILAMAMDDPKGFLSQYDAGPVIIDEAQRWPQLSSWLQTIVDDKPQPGRFFLTGSNQPLLKSHIVQSLAGRAAYLYLPPFDSHELLGHPSAPSSTDEWLFLGGYPPLYDRPFDPVEWFAQYIRTYLERDLTQMIHIKDLHSFQRFLKLCAGRSGQILNMSDLARDADVSHTTVKHWLSVLEAAGILYLLPPWHKNFQKRLVKSPKLFFWDTGLASYLLGVYEAAQWNLHPLRGPMFETLVTSDIIKRHLYHSPPWQWYYWSVARGPEIDLLGQHGDTLRAIEIKSTQTFRPDHLTNLQKFAQLANLPESSLELRYAGNQVMNHRGISVLPWQHFPANQQN